MTLVPDDLPRSPTGRVPQWVIDERAGLAAPPPAWRTGAPPTGPGRSHRGRRGRPWVVGVLVVAASLTAWSVADPQALPRDVVTALAPALDGWRGGALLPDAAPDVVELADAAHLSEEGRRLLYGASPEVLDESEFAGRCSGGDLQADGAVGCYLGPTGTIVVYRPADPRLLGSAVETAAHETLHAAWDRLDATARASLTPVLESVVASLAPDDPVHAQIAGSVGSHGQSRPTELFAYVGTQVWREGGLDPELEAVYARFVTDRAALVATHTAWVATLDGMRADVDAAVQALAAQETASAQERAQLDADVAASARWRAQYEAEVVELDAMPAGRRGRALLSWTWWDGTDLPLAPADETLATAAGLVARDAVELPAREAVVAAGEAAAAAERARVEGLVADLRELHRQLTPGSPGA